MSRRLLTIAFCLLSSALAGFAIGHAQEPASAAVQLKTLQEQAAYSIGLDLGAEVLASAPDVDPAIVARGLIDAMKKAKLLLTPQQAQAAMNQFTAKKLGPGAEKNLKDGQEFLADNKTKQGVVTTDSGLQYFVIKTGTGSSPKATDVVKVHYNGLLLDGKVFDSTIGKEPAEFPVNRVIPGWTEALQLMPIGSKYELAIPPDLAYGSQGPLANQVLLFEVELLGTTADTADVPK
jgi:FKBP-type peptidyl-prolyl cis-trans isomerase FklB